ncbi:MAG: glycosyltransferase [Anaerohalosphaeraceae bacterium]|nr:glycosyltransferase [Anaerohalosphaeraceae bacterium]
MSDDNFTNTDSVEPAEAGKHSPRPVVIVDGKFAYNQFAAIRDFLFGLCAQGIETAFVLPPDTGIDRQLWPRTEIIDYPLLKLPLLWKQNHKSLTDRLEKFKPTVVHCFGTTKIALAKSMSEHFNIPAILSLNSAVLPRGAISKIKTGFIAVIAPSQSIAENLRKNHGKISHLVKHIKFGTFVDESCTCFNLQNQLPSMITVSSLDKFQDAEPLLSALRHLAVDGNEFLAVLMGKGKAKKKIKEFVRAVGLGQTVNLAEETRPLQSIFRGADIYIHLDSVGGYSQMLTEAGSAGLAVAARKSDMGGLLNAGQTAIFFDQTDELSIYSTLQKLLNNRAMARNIAMELQNHLRDNHSISDMMNEFVKIYTTNTI